LSRVRTARSFAFLAVAWGVAFYAIADAIKPGYSSATQYISELNATGTALANEFSAFGFLPIGVLLAAFLFVGKPLARVRGASRLGWWLLWSQPIAFIGVALAPCDAGCPVGGSPTQSLHDLLGVTTYFAGALALVLLSFAPPHPRVTAGVRVFLRAAGTGFVFLFVAMLVPETAAYRGVLQRVADAMLAVALLLVAWRIVRPAGLGEMGFDRA
jgi:hypothetical protein